MSRGAERSRVRGLDWLQDLDRTTAGHPGERGRAPGHGTCRLVRMQHVIRMGVLLLGLAVPLAAQLQPEWITRMPVGAALSAGLADSVVDASGVTYITGIGGSSSNTDVVTAAIALDGTLLWSEIYDGPAGSHDQARALALGPDGSLYVVGSTLGPGSVGQVLMLQYDGATGILLDAVQYSGGLFSEGAAEVAVDPGGDVFVVGGTGGDGSDVLMLKFDASHALQWVETWDGPAFGPFSQDTAKDLALDPLGHPVVLIHGVWNSQQPDYVVLELSPADGSLLWQTNWGTNAGDYPRALVLDGAGDVYVTGTTLQLTDKYGTVKLDGSDGQLIWEAFDSQGLDDSPSGLRLDGNGALYVTGSSDPDGNQSNANNDFYTVKRDAGTGAFLWSHGFGDPCVGCQEGASDVLPDPYGQVFVSGRTSSPPYAPTGDTITFVLDAATGLELDRGVVSQVLGVGAGAGNLGFGPSHEVIDASQIYDANTGQKELTVFQYLNPASPVAYCTAGSSASGGTALISASGIASATASSGFTLGSSGVEGAKDGLFFFGTSGRQANPWGSGDSFQCVVPPVSRTFLLTGSGTPGACDGALSIDLNALWCASCPRPSKNPGAGAVVQAQLWYRDPLNPGNQTTSLSDALEFHVAP